MKNLKIILLLAIAVLVLGFSNSAKAAGQDLSRYVYSETAGWISLNCENTNSCNSVDYSVSNDASGNLSGYGYSQNMGWVNFNPNYGGVIINLNGTISGWAYSERGEWINFNSTKNISGNDLQNEISATKDALNSNNLSDADTMSLLNSLCNKFLSASECDIINN